MFLPASRAVLRSATAAAPRTLPRTPGARRFLSTAPPTQKSRTWKGAAVRWGLAIGAVYYYNTSSVFAEEPAHFASIPGAQTESEQLPTLEAIAAQKRERAASQAQEPTAAPEAEEGALEEEAGQQGAFNPETGEINWDCPCLGGMAHGPCGDEFKAAFSCFVYSKEEPKGMDCIDRFKGMQDCFRQYPEIYGEEIDEENDVTEDGVDASAGQDLSAGQEDGTQRKREAAKAASKQVKESHGAESESDGLVPKAWHDGT